MPCRQTRKPKVFFAITLNTVHSLPSELADSYSNQTSMVCALTIHFT